MQLLGKMNAINFMKTKMHVMWGRTYTRRRRARDIRRAAERAERAVGAAREAHGAPTTSG